MVLDFTKQITKNKEKRIYVMIPTLFDDSIYGTVLDAIDKATYPERLTFGLSIQGVSNIDFSTIKNEKRILFLDKNIAYGVGKTRYHLQQLHNDEDYILSIDCHTGFQDGWDVSLIEEHSKLGSDKAVITQFLYNTFADKKYAKSKYVYSETDNWCVMYLPHADLKNVSFVTGSNKTQRAAPHFLFATKEFAKIPYPYMYFWGDEDSMLSIKLYCNGFDMYELESTFLTTVSKDKWSCIRRTQWFWTAASKYTTQYNIKNLPNHIHDEALGEKALFEYDYHDLEYSYHLLNSEKNDGVNLSFEFANLLEIGYNDILKEDWRGPVRSLWDYLKFHNITTEQLNNTISLLRKRSGKI